MAQQVYEIRHGLVSLGYEAPVPLNPLVEVERRNALQMQTRVGLRVSVECLQVRTPLAIDGMSLDSIALASSSTAKQPRHEVTLAAGAPN